MREPVADITFACQECGRSITFPGERRGRVEECPECGNYVDVPPEAKSPQPLEPAVQTDGQPAIAVSGSRTSTQLWIEVAAVLCLAYIPYAFAALTAVIDPRPSSYSFGHGLFLRIVTALQVSAPLLVILALGREPWQTFGIVRPRWIMDVIFGAIICGTGYIAWNFSLYLVPPKTWGNWAFLHAPPRARLEGASAICLLFVTCVASGFCQELVMRGYLIARLERLLRSTAGAVLVTSVLYASYHIYQGVDTIVGHVAIGILYAVWFCVLRRLWPLCIAHVLHNFLISL